MSLKIEFDAAGNPVMPTLILARHSGYKLGNLIAPYNMKLVGTLRESPEFSFTVNKEEPLWKDILDFKLIYVMEWDTWLQIQVELIDGYSVTKNVDAQGLCKSELSQLLLHGLEFNTDEDIEMDDYKRRIIYDPWDKDASILTAIMDKAPHYKIKHVDESIAKLQKTFSFDGTSIDDALNEICDECDAIVIYNDGTDEETGMPAREISIYDLETICQNENCKYRGDFSDVCPQCGGTDLKYGYGQDTTIFVSKEMLTNEVQYTSDVDSIKNTFKLEAGDDVMTAAIRACNPNGTDYIQYINEETKHDMPEELVQKIDEYEDLFQYYQKEYVLDLDQELIDQYNNLIDEYKDYNIDASKIGYDEQDNMVTLVGYPSLMNVLYDIIDFELALQSSLMPVDQNTETNAEAEAAKLTAANIGTIALDIKYNFELPMVNSIVLSMASYVVDKRYAVKIKDADTNHIVDDPNGTKRWTGIFIVYDPSGDVSVESDQVTLELSTVTEAYVKQRVKKIMAATEDTKDHTVSHLLDIETSLEEFNDEIKWFNIDELYSINDTCMSCMDTLQISGFADKDGRTTQQQSDNYTFYMNYYNKQSSILDEIYRKENQMNVIREVENYIMNVRNEIQDTLNFENYLGTDLYKIFCTYRREDIYSNENYISDGLNNAEIFQNAREFYDIAAKEIYKSAVLQHSITSTLKNLLVIPEFAPIKDYFELGNWIRVEVDGEVNRLRLIRYEIDFENLPEITIEFSDVTRISDGISDIQSLLSKSSSMASSYGAVMHQMNSVQKTKVSVANWIKNGFDATKTKIVNDDGKQDVVIDNHGVLVRSYDDVTESYADTQMKFINSTLAITDDNWQTIKTALGNFIYQDPESGVYYEAYGLIAETIVGDLILGRTLKMYNDSGNMTFDDDGLRVSNGINNIVINPNSDKLFSVNKGQDPMLWFDEEGMLHIEGGDGAGLDISTNSAITGLQTQFSVTASEIRGEITNVNNNLQTILNQTADQIRMEVLNTNSQLSASISVLEGKIRSEVLDQVNSSMSSFEQTADRISLQVQDLAGQMQNINTDFSVVAGEIRGELYDKITEVGSIISQKENSIRSQVSDVANGLSSEILQTKNSIMSQVQNENEEIYTRINQTDKDITAMVNNEINQINTLIYQNDSEIRLVVKNYVDGLASIIQQKDDAIRLAVEDNNRKMQSSLSVYADKIESLVGETSQITQTINKILLRVGDSGIEITDGLITAVAEKINMYGLITFNGLEDYTKSMLNKFRNDIDRIDIGLKQAVYREDVYEIITTESGHSVTYSFDDPPANDPNNEYIDGDLWYKQLQNSDGSNSTHMEIYLRTGNTWVKNDDNKVRIANGTITADMIAANAITANKFSGSRLASLNYLPPSPSNATDYAVGYAQAGSLFDLAGGGIYTPNFVVKNTTYTVQDENGQNRTIQGNGEVYVRGTIYANELILGNNVTIPSNKIDIDWSQFDIDMDGYVTEEELEETLDGFRDTLDIPEAVTDEDILDIVSNYNDLIDDDTKKFITGVSLGDYITYTESAPDASGAITKTISVNDTPMFTETRNPNSDFLILEVPVIGSKKDENGNVISTHKVIVDKDGYLYAENALISGTIYATNGEFSGTLKAATIETIENSYDGTGDEQANQTTITYQGRSIVHQLLNDNGGRGTMYRAVLGKAGNFHLQGNIYFAQPVDNTNNADESNSNNDHGYRNLKGRWLGDIITDLEDAIYSGGVSGNADLDDYIKYYSENTSSHYLTVSHIDGSNFITTNLSVVGHTHSQYLREDSSTYVSPGSFRLFGGLLNEYVALVNESGKLVVGSATYNNKGEFDSISNSVEVSMQGHTHSQYLTSVPDIDILTKSHSSGGTESVGLIYGTNSEVWRFGPTTEGHHPNLGGSGNWKWGAIYTTDSSASSDSDERMKTILGSFDERHKKLFMDVNPILFKWNKMDGYDEILHWGFGAQSVEKAFKENGFSDDEIVGVYKGEDDYYYMKYTELQVLNWYVTKENTCDIESLQEKLTYMEKENKVLKKYISELADKIERLSAKIN